MDLLSFLKFIYSPDKPGFFVLQFIATEYNYLFFSNITKILKKDLSYTLITIDINKLSIDEIISKLSMGFLGQRIIYWIKDFSTLSDLDKNALAQYFDNYSGSNSIIYFDTIARNKNNLFVNLSNSISKNEYLELYKIFYQDLSFNMDFSQKLFEFDSKISLDTACLLMFYDSCLGRNSDLFFKKWFNKIVSSEKSFFNLSTFLFERNRKQFFFEWLKYKEEYAPEFWVSFFSELIWQAILFINRATKYGIIDAKKVAQKLPFSFMNKTWKQFDVRFLIKNYQELYNIDYNLKNGGASFALDLWCCKFLV